MKQEIIERLAIAEQFSHNAQYARVARQAVADGYASVDAMFSAFLEDEGVVPPRNHRQKLEEVRRRAAAMFDERRERCGSGFSYMGGIDWADLETFCREWLTSRYERFEMSAGFARGRVAMTLQANNLGVRWLADRHGEDWIDVQAAVSRAAYGYDQSRTTEALSHVHDYLFAEAEAYGERIGRKLATKMASVTNFCGADIVAGDDITRGIIEEDERIARHASRVYVDFCRLMEEIRTKRLEAIQARDPAIGFDEALDAATDFKLSMKAKYHGEPLSDIGEGVSRMIERSITMMPAEAPCEEVSDNVPTAG